MDKKVANGCGIIVLNKEGNILLGQRVKSKEGEPKLMYSLPGGEVEEDERQVDACIRELKEETGLTYLNGIPICECIVEVNPFYYKDDVTYVCTDYEGTLRDTPDEMINWNFYSIKEILTMLVEGKLYPAAGVSITNYLNWLGARDYVERLSM